MDEFHPFDEELSFGFYRVLPDLSRFVQTEGVAVVSSDYELDDMNKKLQKAQSKDQIDERATEFMKQNPFAQFKAGRKEMAKILFSIPRNSLALVPFYARFTAIIHQYFK